MDAERTWLKYGRIAMWVVLGIAAAIILGTLVWQGITSSGNPDPEAAGITPTAAIVNIGLLVFREGLEAILVIAAVTASMVGTNQKFRKPVGLGVSVGLLATIATWFIVIAILNNISAMENVSALDIQAGTGLLAIVVLLVVMNWFFHKVYWTGWISMHNKRKKNLLAQAGADTSKGKRKAAAATTEEPIKSAADTAVAKRRAAFGLALLGFTAMYREGFEVVLFLQDMRLKQGNSVVLQGVLIGLAFTVAVGILTFVLHHQLPYKKMLILTGIFLAGVLVVMVGENIQEMQDAHWIATTAAPIPIPDWMGMWFAVFPNWETLVSQFVAVVAVIGSYAVSRYLTLKDIKKSLQKTVPSPEATPISG